MIEPIAATIFLTLTVVFVIAYHIIGIANGGSYNWGAFNILKLSVNTLLLFLAGFFSYPGAPQIIMSVLILLSVIVNLVKDGDFEEYRPVGSFISSAMLFGLLYWGGFFNAFM